MKRNCEEQSTIELRRMEMEMNYAPRGEAEMGGRK
jgi:hypothetical protein